MKRIAYMTLMLLTLIAPALAAKHPVYEPQGAPADPKVPAHWDRYHDYAAATKLMQRMAKAWPDQCRLKSLGLSYGKREMWVMTISDSLKNADEKPAFYIDGGIHANEIQGTEVSLYTAWYLLEMNGRSDTIHRLMQQRTFYIIPMMSPDSRDAHMYKPNSTHSPRSGQIPVDDDRDGLVNEDGPDDLDHDGSITQMRIRDPNGKYKPDPDFPEMMVRVGPGEKGEYTMLGPEGIDNDGDGRVNEDGDGYYDPNREWPWDWQPGYVQWGAYRYPLSIPEDRMAADFIASHPNIAGAQSYHNAAGMIIRGPGSHDDHYPQSDIRVYDLIGKKGEMILPGYHYIQLDTGLYPAYGAELNWLYSMRGVLTFTNELLSPDDYFHDDQPGPMADAKTLHKFNKYLLFNDGFVPWHKVHHPQYGDIEVGGFKKGWVRQPPAFMLEEECHRNMAFTLYQADQMPMVRVQSATVKSLGGGLTQVTATVVNRRAIPTRLAVDVQRKITPPDRVTLSGKDVKVVAGLISDDPFFTDAQEQKRDPRRLRLDTIDGNDAVYVRWLVTGGGPFTVTIQSVKGGADSMTVLEGKSEASDAPLKKK